MFTEAAEFTGQPPYSVAIVSREGGLVRTASGVVLGSSRLDDPPEKIDTLIVPGAAEAPLRAFIGDDAARDWTLATTRQVRRLASVCTGAFALAAWGLLEGRRAATHWAAAAEFAQRFPSVTLNRDALFVEDGPVWTSAGVSTGIDMALAMAERDLGRAAATSVARRLVLPVRRPGHQSQFSALLEMQAGPYAELVEWIGQNLAADLSPDALAARMGQAPRTFHRRFSAEAGSSPAAFVTRLRLDRARTLLEAGVPLKRAATECGFGSADRLGRTFRRALALSPSTYQALYGA